jgi:hypothetical protein
MLLALALVLTVMGAFALRLAWQSGKETRTGRQLGLRLTGWGLLIAALIPASMAGGPDRGPALALLTFMLAGLGVVLREGWRANRRPDRTGRERALREEPTRAGGIGGSLLLKRIWIFCLAGPIALAAALALGLSLWLGLARAGVAEADVLATAMLSVPIVWALLSVLATMQGGLATRTLIVAVPGLAAAGAAMALSGPLA